VYGGKSKDGKLSKRPERACFPSAAPPDIKHCTTQISRQASEAFKLPALRHFVIDGKISGALHQVNFTEWTLHTTTADPIPSSRESDCLARCFLKASVFETN
jgi:hypothetical protein